MRRFRKNTENPDENSSLQGNAKKNTDPKSSKSNSKNYKTSEPDSRVRDQDSTSSDRTVSSGYNSEESRRIHQDRAIALTDERMTYPSDWKDFEVMEKLGQGGFGSVFKVKLISTSETFALKKVHLETYSDAKRAMVEIKTMEKCEHPHIINYFKFFVHGESNAVNLCILMEYAPGGDLLDRIKKQKNDGSFFEEQKILQWFMQICLAVDYIHEKKIIHRDLKPQNILLIREDCLKLADFGIAKVLESTSDLARTLVGTMFYMAPEVYNGDEYTTSADIWSLGALLITMASIQKPFREVKSYLRGEFVDIPNLYEHILTLVQLTVVLDPDSRLPIPDLLLELDKMLTKKNKMKGCCVLL